MLELNEQILYDRTQGTKAIHQNSRQRGALRHPGPNYKPEPGVRAYNYVRDFLTDRNATLIGGDMETEELKMVSEGTTQGSVISPLIFNFVMINLLWR